MHCNLLSQQHIESSNLVKFLQEDTDSTIIYFNSISSPLASPDYFIISKAGNQFIYSTYINPFKQYSLMYNIPAGEIAAKFRRDDTKYKRTEIDTNQYFRPYLVPSKQHLVYWNEISQFTPWQLNDDSDTTWKDSSKCDIYDGRALQLLLITKNTITHLFYSNPEFYEECYPGNINRQRVLKIEEIFKKIYR